MKIAIMQPYFFPYLGYFQLINCVDQFVIYDNIEYTKKGWFNRNRYLCNGQDKYFTIPITKDSDYLDVKERTVAKDFDRQKLQNQIKMAYSKSEFFKEIYPVFCDCVEYRSQNLFDFIYYSVKKIVEILDIQTEIIVSSTLDVGHEKKGKDKVIAICERLKADQYINSIGGKQLYDKNEFLTHGIELLFLEMDQDIVYPQFRNDFVPGLSILDVLMFNSIDDVKKMLSRCQLI